MVQVTMTLNIANASSYVYVDGLSLATETFSLWIEDNDEADITDNFNISLKCYL